MAFTAHSYWSTLDQTSNTNVYDYSPYFYRSPMMGGEVVLWPLLKKREDLDDTTCRWYEDSRLPVTVTANASTGALTTADGQTTLNVVAGTAASRFITIGTLLRDTAAAKREVVLVTAISTDALTITRAYGRTDTSGSGDRETHANSAVWQVVGHLNSEGSTLGNPEATNLTERTNTTSIIDQNLTLTRTEMRRVLQAGVGDPFGYQVEKALAKFERLMEQHVIWSRGVTRASTPVPGSMDGIQDIIVARAGSNYDTTSEAFSYEVFDDSMKLMWENGYGPETPFILVVPAAGKQYAAYIHESAMRAPYDSFSTRGMKATHLVSTFGHEVPIVPSVVLQSDEYMILNLDLLAVRFVDTMLAYDVPLGEAGADKQSRRFISEFSLEMHNADTAHYYHTGVTYTRPS